ncbi:hypothetical protein CYMTET_33851 [Cymbomonas tetramitiformis]|uniref:DNA-dependent protein kinase catalytic subunit CC3 domain-containing protein n=1 Tax=Cymbomonas tetramitiformis TaxID=36881 RepID=A0AAE0FC61_9CHLO|nr:hypothetical protein CYMTET_33851 [Cymbomonas tetramitiformis]
MHRELGLWVYTHLEVEQPRALQSSERAVRRMRRDRDAAAKGTAAQATLISSTQYVTSATLSQTLDLDEPISQKGVPSVPNVDVPVKMESEARRAVEVLGVLEDDFDRNPCMPRLVQLIEHMAEMGVSSWGHAELPPGAVPAWMQMLARALEDRATPSAARLFLAKALLHVQARAAARREASTGDNADITEDADDGWVRVLFDRHAWRWVEALLELFVHDPEAVGGRTFHYMLRDACVAMLQWEPLFAAWPTKHATARAALAKRLVTHLCEATLAQPPPFVFFLSFSRAAPFSFLLFPRSPIISLFIF